ncbi:Uma2 family endonuclease [Aurantimonas sp. MSK8Z-1]|uniref:Uma2 family endonuclease n=1 Tax=Mangrovibrevibacter kandeliae TaxID=2968473 RepID=UPI002118263D|nr:Uma2 family endonuclease [Aurantimonas sp. MSK8Z-1]MCW4113585.1 Uma2 family endonuclease [Aurantimonas sp. MSK8Z-1]
MSAIEDLVRRGERKFDEAAYLHLLAELPAGDRWELIDGIAIEMPPATIRHAVIDLA